MTPKSQSNVSIPPPKQVTVNDEIEEKIYAKSFKVEVNKPMNTNYQHMSQKRNKVIAAANSNFYQQSLKRNGLTTD